jgi:hypothetical protein
MKLFKLLSLKNSVSYLNLVRIMCSAMTSSSCNPSFSLIKFKNDFSEHKTLMIVSWKFESCKSLREHNHLISSNSKLDRWIMFLMLQRFMEIFNDLEFSHFSIPGISLVNPNRTFWMMIYLYCYFSHYLHDFE